MGLVYIGAGVRSRCYLNRLISVDNSWGEFVSTRSRQRSDCKDNAFTVEAAGDVGEPFVCVMEDRISYLFVGSLAAPSRLFIKKTKPFTDRPRNLTALPNQSADSDYGLNNKTLCFIKTLITSHSFYSCGLRDLRNNSCDCLLRCSTTLIRFASTRSFRV